jgi:NitT/TauT family transport system permease protein
MPVSRKAKVRIGHIAFFVACFLLLELLVLAGTINELVLSRPSRVALRLWLDIEGKEFWESLATSVVEVSIAVVISMIVGSMLGLAFYRLQTFRRAVEPGLVAFYSAPALLLYPVFIAVLGPGSATVITMAVVLSSVPIAINIAVGLAGIEPIWRRVGRSLQATPQQMLLLILVPAAIPTIVTGFRLGLTFALIGVISLEFLLYSGGLGKLVSWRYFVFDTDGVYSAIVVVSGIAILINASLNLLERSVRRRWA